MSAELDELNTRNAAFDAEFRTLTSQDADLKRFMEIPGIGPMFATTLMVTVGGPLNLAAWLGLTSRQLSTGGKAKLIGISKRGNT